MSRASRLISFDGEPEFAIFDSSFPQTPQPYLPERDISFMTHPDGMGKALSAGLPARTRFAKEGGGNLG